MNPIQIDPTFNDRSSDIERLVDKRANDILKGDVCYEYRKLVKYGINSGLIRKKTEEEIKQEIKQKPWLEVNKTIRKNEDRNNMATNSNLNSD